MGPALGAPLQTPSALALDTAGLPASFPSLDRAANTTLRLLWITCGTGDGLIGVNRQFEQYLDAQGVKVTWRRWRVTTQGSDDRRPRG